MFQNLIYLSISLFLAVAGQISIKNGLNQIGAINTMSFLRFLIRSFTSYWVLIGLALYVISTITWLMLLSRVNLSFAYPLISISYILILIFSAVFLHESIGILKILGVVLICLGIIFIFRS